MPSPNFHTDGNNKTRKKRGTILLRILGAWVLAVVCLILLRAVGQFNPLLQQNMYLAAAILFMVIPYVFLRRRAQPHFYPGPSLKPLRRNLVAATVAMAITFPIYGIGFHLYQEYYLHQEAQFSLDLYHRWPVAWDRVYEKEVGLSTQQPITAFMDRNNLHIQWNLSPPPDSMDKKPTLDPSSPILHISGDSSFHILSAGRNLHVSGSTVQTSSTGESSLILKLRADPRTGRYPLKGGEVIRIDGGSRLEIKQLQFGSNVEESSLMLGSVKLNAGASAGGRADSNPIDTLSDGSTANVAQGQYQAQGIIKGKRSSSWILWIVLFHLILVAIPEEFFFRGFIQTDLDRAINWRITIGGLSIPWASILVTSALFAMGHYLVDLSPARLSVFFPSILFGLLRSGTGSIGAAATYHAMCNVLVELLSRGYGPIA